MKMRVWRSILLCSAAAAVALPFQAMAQEGAEREAGADIARADRDVIVVTARKREESILEVPVVVTALSAGELEAYSSHDLQTLSSRIPGFVVGESIAANGTQVSIRGIGTAANNATVDQSVALVIDGLQLSQGLAYRVGMFDLAQAEVFKGPQALYFGKNSPAGVVSLRSQDPTDEFEAILRAGYEFEAEQKVGEAILSGPISNSLRGRIAVRYSDENGFFFNVAEALPGLGGRDPAVRNVSPTESLILRGTLLFDPSDRYSARLKVSYDELNIDGQSPASQVSFCPDGIGAVAPVNIQFLVGEDCVLNEQINIAWPDPAAFPGISNGGDPFTDQEQTLISLEQSFDLSDEVNITSVTTYYSLDQTYLFPGSTVGGSVALVADNRFVADQFTQEVRLSTDLSGSPFNFVLGAFYQNAEQSPKVFLIGNTALGLPATLQRLDSFVDIESRSVFGQILWDINPKLELTAGARWTEEERVHSQFNYNPANGPLGESSILVPRISSNNISPEVTLTYMPTDNFTVFAAYRTGFKSGSFNGVVFASPTTDTSFDDESAEGGEIGIKSRLLDGQLLFNAAAYFYEYSDLQVGANEIDGNSGALVLRTLNAASAEIKGIEFDASYSPRSAEGLTIYGAANYNNGRYSSFPNAQCGNGQSRPQGCDQLLNQATGRFTSQDLTGEPLVRAPDWTGNVGFSYEQPVGQNLLLDFGSYVNYSSEYSTNLVNNAGFYQDAFAKFNANIVLRDADNRWEVALIGNNLSNEITTANSFNSNSQNGVIFGGQIQGGETLGAAGNDEATMVADRGREVWLRLTANFGG